MDQGRRRKRDRDKSRGRRLGWRESTRPELPTFLAMRAATLHERQADVEAIEDPEPTTPSETKDGDSTQEPDETTSMEGSATPTPTATGSQTDSTSTSTASTSSEAPWASARPGSMQPFSDSQTTIRVVGVSEGFTFECPKKGDSWKDVTLGTELHAKYAEGPGCYMEYQFTGDSIQIFGTTGTEAGIFGCFVTTPLWNSTEWWDASGGATQTNAYAGSCQMNGLGYSEHTVRLVNSPLDPKKVYFTGLRYTTNKTQVPWSNHQWDTCCPSYTFPEGQEPTIVIGGATTNNATASGSAVIGGTVIAGMSNGAALFLVMAVIGVISVATILLL
ncbi:hypothetical protein JCM3766R1_005680 [Sporobolomyces carnicolor]